jgi:hypothetical protein
MQNLTLSVRAGREVPSTELSLLSGLREMLLGHSSWLRQYPLPTEVMDGRCKLGLAVENYDYIEADSLQALREVFQDANGGRGPATLYTGDALVLTAQRRRAQALMAP